MDTLLSVIIPAHNEEKTICKTVDSLLQQDYSYFEIIVVDDGSEDNTDTILINRFGLCLIETVDIQCTLRHKPIVKIWNKRCNNIYLYLVQKENGGKGDALNTGIDFCHGDYFVCIDADCIFSSDTLSNLTKALCKRNNIVAVGGRVLPLIGLHVFFRQKGFHFREALLGFQELEYGIAFCIIRPIIDKIGTSMLISGALGLFNKDFVIQIGGYALDTVGEDMELVMRIRQFAAENDEVLIIAYTKEAVCFTELPWMIFDLIKQRIRWTVGLSEVLWRYRNVVTQKKYCFEEKTTFWYYVIFEKYSPHIEFTSMLIYVCCGKTLIGLAQILIIAFLQMVLSLVGSYSSIKQAIQSSDSKIKSVTKIGLLLIFFVTVYHYAYLIVRLIAVPYYWIKKHKSDNKNTAWISPTRM